MIWGHLSLRFSHKCNSSELQLGLAMGLYSRIKWVQKKKGWWGIPQSLSCVSHQGAKEGGHTFYMLPCIPHLYEEARWCGPYAWRVGGTNRAHARGAQRQGPCNIGGGGEGGVCLHSTVGALPPLHTIWHANGVYRGWGARERKGGRKRVCFAPLSHASPQKHRDTLFMCCFPLFLFILVVFYYSI
jgi:hypothetical protein